MHWLQQNYWIFPAAYALACEIVAHTPLKSNSVIQLALAAVKSLLSKKDPNA